MKKVLVIAAVTMLIAAFCTAALAEPQVVFKNNPAGRTYYLCSSHNAHAYFAESHLGLRYAAEYFGVNIVALGPDGWDTAEQAKAVEQAIAKSPAGIITRFWDASPLAAVRKATEAGIPVVATETRIGTSAADIGGALTYIGLDNKQSGWDTAAELVRIAGDTGKVVCMGNWGAANTDAKLAGVKECLAQYPGWEIIAEVDYKADATAAIEAGKTVVNNYPAATAVIGLDSSSGTGLGKAMEELNKPAGSYKVVVNDREPSVLQYIEEGYIDATMCNKTAADEYVAILIMEDYNNGGIKNVPLSSNNAAAGVHGVPENMYNTVFAINRDNVKYFFADEMPNIKTDLYNK